MLEVIKSNLKDVLYPEKNLVVRPAPEVKINATMIEGYDGRTLLLFQGEGGLEEKRFDNVFVARDFANQNKIEAKEMCFGSSLLQKMEQFKNGK